MTPWVTYGEPMRYPHFTRASAPDSSSATPIVVFCSNVRVNVRTPIREVPVLWAFPLSIADIGAGLSDVRGSLLSARLQKLIAVEPKGDSKPALELPRLRGLN
jgi:hypothetical protein